MFLMCALACACMSLCVDVCVGLAEIAAATAARHTTLYNLKNMRATNFTKVNAATAVVVAVASVVCVRLMCVIHSRIHPTRS